MSLDDGRRIRCRILVDGTELGDVAAAVGAEELSDRVSTQDMTYVAIVKEYDHDVSMPEPEGYDRELYRSCCDNPLAENKDGFNPLGQQLWSPEMMLSYGRLPDGHIMLNWPVCANDIYFEYLDMSPQEREEAFQKARQGRSATSISSSTSWDTIISALPMMCTRPKTDSPSSLTSGKRAALPEKTP